MPKSTTAVKFFKKSLSIFMLALLAILFMPQQGKFSGTAQAQNARTLPGGSLGYDSDSDLWRAVKSGNQGNVTIPDQKSGVMVQPAGQVWRDLRNGPLFVYGSTALLATIALLSLFFAFRGRIKIDGGRSGITVTRFNAIERYAHWVLAGSFIILGLTGLNMVYGKFLFIPVFGKDAFATISIAGKWVHNFVSFAFILGIVLILVLWIKHNFPNRHDIIWLLKGGGLFTKGSHPPARKFNAGQKILFWLILIAGASISLSGLSLLFPFQLPIFAKTFSLINALGFDLPTEISGIQEMQLSQLWHSIVSTFMVCIILAHIYIGTLGMESAFDAMGSGEVDKNWAKEHHSLWVEELERDEKEQVDPVQVPAE